MAQLEAQFSVRTEAILNETAVENIDDYTHFYEQSVANRLLDRFRFIGPRGESSKLEYLDRSPDTHISAEGILKPPSWSDALPQMIEISKVTEWCIDYGEDPSIWIRSSEGAWYRLDRPANDYRWTFGSTRRKFEICARLYILSKELIAEEMTYRYIVDLLGQQYYNMRSNKESDILDVAGFVLGQMETASVPNLLKSEFMERLRSHQLERAAQARNRARRDSSGQFTSYSRKLSSLPEKADEEEEKMDVTDDRLEHSDAEAEAELGRHDSEHEDSEVEDKGTSDKSHSGDELFDAVKPGQLLPQASQAGGADAQKESSIADVNMVEQASSRLVSDSVFPAVVHRDVDDKLGNATSASSAPAGTQNTASKAPSSNGPKPVSQKLLILSTQDKTRASAVDSGGSNEVKGERREERTSNSVVGNAASGSDNFANGEAQDYRTYKKSAGSNEQCPQHDANNPLENGQNSHEGFGTEPINSKPFDGSNNVGGAGTANDQ